MSFVQEHTNDDGQGWPYAVKDTTAGMQEVERIRTNIGHIRVKMSGTNFPDRVEESENGDLQGRNVCRLCIVTRM